MSSSLRRRTAARRGRARRAKSEPWRSYRRKNTRQRLLQLIEGAVVADHELRSLRLFLLGQLATGARGDRRVAPLGGPALANLLVCDHRDRAVESRSHARLEEQRHLHDGPPAAEARQHPPQPSTPASAPHPRPQRALQPLPCLVVAEHLARHQRPIHSAVRGHLLAESFDDQRPHLRHSKQVVHHRVRRQRPRPSSPSARSASDFPAPSPPVRPTRGTTTARVARPRALPARAPRRAVPRPEPAPAPPQPPRAAPRRPRSGRRRTRPRRARDRGLADVTAGIAALTAAGSRAGRRYLAGPGPPTRLTLSDSRRRSSRSRGSSRARRRRARPPRAGSRRSAARARRCARGPRRRP